MNERELELLKRIKPSQNETKIVNEFTKRLIEKAEKIAKPFYADPLIVGSISKGTWLKGDHDIDLFIVFRKKIERKKLEERGLQIGVELCKQLGGTYDIRYAEHPYVRLKVKSFYIDVVPCYHIKKGEKIISAVDRSPHHNDYIKETLKNFQKDEVRLLKYFCKKTNIYGADAKTNGFSGYLCELLVVTYGTFRNVLKEMQKLDFGEVVDPQRYAKQISNLKGSKYERKLKKKFRNDSLIVVDPVDSNRNVAAPVHPINLLRFKIEAKKYLETGKFPQKRRKTKLELIRKLKKDRESKFIGLKFNPPDIIPENLYPQLRKFEKRVARYLRENDFRLLRHFSWTNETNKAYLIFEVENSILSNYKKKEGPIIFSNEVENFLKKYKDYKYKPYIDDNRFYVCYKRRITDVASALKQFLNSNRAEIPKKIAERKISIFWEADIIDEVNKNKELNSYLVKEYFEF